MTWWLSASPEELREAATCTQCGNGDSDIDLGICYACFQRMPQSEQWMRNAAIARKYRDYGRARLFEQRANEALAKEASDESQPT